MRFISRIAVVVTLVILSFAVGASAKWAVEIESKTVEAGATGVTLDFTAYWDLALSAVSLPLVVREVDEGAFWTGVLPYDTGDATGFYHPYPYHVAWSWASPWATLTEGLFPSDKDAKFNPCTPMADTLYNGVPPDNFMLAAAGTGAPPCPATPNGRKYCTITFDVTDVGGRFEFDTACVNLQLKTLYLIDDAFPPVDHASLGTGEATFTKGVVTINKDTDEDGIPDHLDNCWLVHNPAQEDDDADSVGNVCDNCQLTYNPEQENSDTNGTDAYGDSCDNCPFLYNPEQRPEDCPSGILEIDDAVPGDYSLMQNYPNPFNANTVIEFALREGGYVRLEVYDILGQKVTTLVDEYLSSGRKQVAWTGKDARGRTVSSGMYFYRLSAGDFTEMKKMVLMK
jgi:rubredoxin